MKRLVLAFDGEITLQPLLEVTARGVGAIGPGCRGTSPRLVEGDDLR